MKTIKLICAIALLMLSMMGLMLRNPTARPA